MAFDRDGRGISRTTRTPIDPHMRDFRFWMMPPPLLGSDSTCVRPLEGIRPPLEPRRAPPGALAPDSYVTDGDRLFRVVSQFTTVGDNVFASLEDCLTLEVRPFAPG